MRNAPLALSLRVLIVSAACLLILLTAAGTERTRHVVAALVGRASPKKAAAVSRTPEVRPSAPTAPGAKGTRTPAAPAPACAAPPPDIISWYPGDGVAVNLYWLTRGTTTGGVTYAAGKVGPAFTFDGTGDIEFEADRFEILRMPVTLAAWVRPDARDGTDFPTNVLSGDTPGNFGHGFGLNVGGGGATSQLKVEYFSGFRDVSAAHPGLTFAAGQWYHIGVVYTVGNVKTYVNGTLADSFDYAQQAGPASPEPLRIGKHNHFSAPGGSGYFSGQVDEVQLFDRALSAVEVQYIYQTDSAGLCKPLVVDSITRAGADPVFHNSSVVYAVTFNKNVSGVDASDFALTTTGSLPTASVTNVTGSGRNYSVTVATGSGAGTVRLDLINDNTIRDESGGGLSHTGANANGNFTAGESYAVARDADFDASATSLCNRRSVTFTAQDVGLPATYHWDFPGGSPSTFDGFTPPPVTYNTAGAFDVSLAITTSSLSDSKTKGSYINVGGGPDVTINTPSLVDTNSTNTASVTDAGPGASYDWTVSGGAIGAGQGTRSITWTAGAGTTTTLSVLVTPAVGCDSLATKTVTLNDRVPPSVVSVTRGNPNPALPNQTVALQVEFSEDVTGVDASDFALTRTGANTDSAVTGVTGVSDGGDRKYIVTVATGAGSGTFRLDLLDDDSITDANGNHPGGAGAGNGGFTSGPAYTVFPTLARGLEVEILAPSNALLTEGFCARSDAPSSSVGPKRRTVVASAQVSATVEPPPVVTLRCTEVTGLRLVNFAGAASNFVGEGDFLFTAAKDSSYATHFRLASNYGKSQALGVAVLINSRERMSYNDDTDTFFYGTKPINFPRTPGFTIDFQYGGWFKFIDGDHFQIRSASGALMSATNVDLSVPDLLPASDTGASDTDDLTGLNTNLQFALPYALRAPGQQFDLLRDGAVVATVTSGDDADATLTDPGVVPDGTHAYTIRRHSDSGITTPLNVTVEAAPFVVSVARAGTSPAVSGTSVTYNVTFSEPVTGVDASDFVLTTTGPAAGASVTSVSADAGATRTVTVNTGAGAGTLRLDVLDDDSIRSAVNKQLGGLGSGNGNFSAGEVYTLYALNVAARDARAAQAPAGTTQMLFAVTLSNPAPQGGLTLSYATADGGPGAATGGGDCGTAGVDYVGTSGTLSVPEGRQIAAIPVTVCAASGTETDETLLFNLSNLSAGTLSNPQAVGTIAAKDSAGPLLISELRTSGPAGAGDDFVEFYNNTDSSLTVTASDGSGGYGLFKMGATCNDSPVLVGTIPNGTVIPARGHYLAVGSQYSLADYGGTGAAAGDLTLTSDIESDRDVAVFSTANAGAISSASRLDAVGFGANTGSVCDLLREGATLGPLSGSTAEHSYFRNMGQVVGGNPKDTNDNAADFFFADTQGSLIAGVRQRLGAPGPENLASPIRRDNSGIGLSLLDGSASSLAPPNRVRSFGMGTNATFGTLTIRRRVTNNTGAPVTRLRFRIVEVTTFPVSSPGTAELRVLSSSSETDVGPINDPMSCAMTGATAPCLLPVIGTTLEEPPAQTNGGGFNSTLSVGTITLGTPLAAGGSVPVRFVLGVQQTGTFRFLLTVEALP